MTYKSKPPKKLKDCWKTIDLEDGQSIDVLLRPPTYEQLLVTRAEQASGAAVLMRYDCVIDWRDVFVERPDGSSEPVPFSQDALRDFLRDCRPAFRKILDAINPLFLRPEEDELKNSDPQSAAGTAPSNPSPNTTNSGDLADSAKPSAMDSPSTT